mgnify:CR=1
MAACEASRHIFSQASELGVSLVKLRLQMIDRDQECKDRCSGVAATCSNRVVNGA